MLFPPQFFRPMSAATLIVSFGLGLSISAQATEKAPPPLLATYANIALDAYDNAESDVKKLQKSLSTFTSSTTAANLAAAKKAWLVSRESYGQTEIFRLSNGPVDAEEGWVEEAYGALEGQINAWPLDENMIDYTVDAEGHRTSGNIIDTAGKFSPGGEDAESVDTTSITVAVITALNENGGDANVASGYHAIEFLLWGQDQDYDNFVADKVTNGALVAGQRPLADFTEDKFAKRRLAYLNTAADKLLADLGVISDAWSKKTSGNCDKDATGCYRAAILGQLKGADAAKNIPREAALKQIVAGMGVFLKSELANERIAVAVLTPSEEDEHSCFSDNTHRDIALNYLGFVNVLKGEYEGKGYGDSFYAKSSAETKAKIDGLVTAIDAKVAHVNELAQSKWHFDYQIMPGNNASEIRKMKNEMRMLGDAMVLVANDLGLSLTEEDMTDPEETTF
ncbi:MAG: imelysin [Cellvibrionales bacterium]|nr:MAG: imelysin [Cellvibrionales bacterium]